jgi:recombinational DNA repair protein (RecF pathway)
MLYAEARSVREERSRQRYALQDFSLVRVSLVKGKRSWKIGSIEAKQNYFAEATTKEARGSIVSTVRFLRRFLSGQEAAPDLFEYIVMALTHLSGDVPNRISIEKTIQVRLLKELGYVDEREVPAGILLEGAESIARDHSTETLRVFDTVIEKAVSTSHL